MGLWETFGRAFQGKQSIPNIPTIPKTPHFRDSRDFRHKDQNLKTVVLPLTPDGLPDYAAWCADWWRGCFACPDFMPERVRFCRRWNRAVHGVDVVALAPVAMGDHPCQGETLERGKPSPRQETGRAWWCGRKEAAA